MVLKTQERRSYSAGCGSVQRIRWFSQRYRKSYNPKCLRGSAGSAFRVPLVASIEADEILDQMRLTWYAAMPRAQKLLGDADLVDSCGIIIGSEARGVSPELAGRATGLRIPTAGVESLNAAVAAGILLYEAGRQRAARGTAAKGTP
jgi:TrmH family RNA methyltransferase